MCKNWYSSTVQTQGLSQQVLYGTPGLNEVANTGGTSLINRGSHTKEGIPYFVQGERLYSVIKTVSLGADVFTANYLGVIPGTDRISSDDNGTQLMIIASGQGYIYNESSQWSGYESSEVASWSAVAYGNSTYVSVAPSLVMTSSDGITWTSRTAAAALSWESVVYGEGLFVATSSDGTGNRVMTSPDGITWTSRTSSADEDWYGLAYGGGLFVAIGYNSAAIMTSPDGITWTARTSPVSSTFISVAFGGGLYVAVSQGGKVITSPDGITWTERTIASAPAMNSVVYGNGLWVVMAYNPNGIFTSPDGITWTERVNPIGNNFMSVAYGNGKFVAVANFSATQPTTPVKSLSSIDGIEWFASPLEAPTTLNESKYLLVSFVNGDFVMISPLATTTSQVFISPVGASALQNIVDVDTDFDANGTPEKVRFIDSYFLVTTNSKKFIRSDANNGLAWNALNFGTAEADPDAIKALEIDNNKAFLFGAETIEPFDNVGGSGFGFQRSGLLYNKGVTSGDSVIKTTAGISFLGQGKDESPAMWSLTAGQLVKISHPGIDNEINGYSLADLEACFAQYYAEAGEFFVSFTFPLKTFVYGFASELWHERESSGLRWRVNSLTKAYGTIFAGDAIDGRIGELALDIYHEYDNYIEAQVSSPNFSNQGDRAFYPKIEATMEAGMGNADTPNPVLTYDYSDDGKIFKGARSRSLGKKGKYNMRTIWRRNGSAPRFRTNRFTFTGKNKRAFLKLEAEIEA